MHDHDGDGTPPARPLTRQERWRQRNPDAHRAHEAVKYALRSGRLTKQPCEDCGSPHAEAHHPDYTKPLTVVWLCRVHHKRRHQRKITKGPGGTGKLAANRLGSDR